jgi:multidrug efflux pump subunit AcrA (membrane-fusion protein)
MGMDYVPVYADEVAPPRDAKVPGLVTIRVGEESLRVAGLQTAPAVRQALSRTVRTVGIVTPDEGRIRHVHTKIAGWVEHLSVNFTGQTVERGQPILSLYSPELLASQEEFLKARETAGRFAASSSAAARRRLELFDVPERSIGELAREGQPRRTVTLNAPSSGFVTSKGIFEGQEVQPGMELFTVTDLSQVWIEAALYEYEAQTVRVGQEATLALPYDPGVVLRGRVAFVYPYLSPESRTLKVRFDFPNPNLVLKPAMYVDVTLALASAEGIVIPDSAVLDTGVRRVVFVETATGTFAPREVRLGVRGDGRAQVLAGVVEGEKVVVKANFLLDSESRLRSALTKIAGGAR